MKQSKIFIPTCKEINKNIDNTSISNKLLLKSGYIYKNFSGIYSYLPLALIVLNKIKKIIKIELKKIGAFELQLPNLIPFKFFELTGRDKIYNKELFCLNDRNNKKKILSPTNEEIITDLVKNTIISYKNIPLNFYQIQNKFRDEKRVRFGLLRSKEFIMKDAYSFHMTEKDLNNIYNKYYNIYINIFNKFKLKFYIINGNNYTMNSNESKEFISISNFGEETLYIENNKNIRHFNYKKDKYIKNKIIKGIEIGHIFKLGIQYSKVFNLKILDKNNKENFILMGCYGIGISRLLSAIVEQHNNKKNIIWPLKLAPFHIHIIPVNINDNKQLEFINYLENILIKLGYDVLIDDRNEKSFGIKLNDSDLIGCPIKIIINKYTWYNNIIEFQNKNNNEILKMNVNYLKIKLRNIFINNL